MPADRSVARKPAQEVEPRSSDEGSDARVDAPVPAVGAVPETVVALDNPSPADAEGAVLGTDRHAGASLAATEEPGTQVGTAASDPQSPLPEPTAPVIAVLPGVPEHSASGSAAPAQDEMFVQDGQSADSLAAEAASEPPPAVTDASETGVLPDSHTADTAAALATDHNPTPTGELADANGKDEQQPLSQAAAVRDFPESGAEAVAPDLGTDADAQSGPPEPAEEPETGALPAVRTRPSKPAQHRDRRGQRRAVQPQPSAGPKAIAAEIAGALRAPAEARLRLMIHPVRRTVSISAVLARPAGYPDCITLLLGHSLEVGAYGEDRYDDVDLDWTPSLLAGEVRLDSSEGYRWLRSSRRIHIFSEQADEQGLMSVGSASLNSSSAVVCTQDDAEAVRSAAAACGSPELVSHGRWSGVPAGWEVLSGYRPAHAASVPLDPGLTTLDPGVGAEIRLSGGLQVRSGSFAQGSPPRIEIEPFPIGAQVTIDGNPAEMDDGGCWRAPGWDGPGDHLVDVVPGPSLTYRIVGDPWVEGGWECWDAHAGRFQTPNGAPWARVQICGASVSGPSGEHVVAAKAMPSVIALGLRRGVAMLRSRPDAPVAVGLLREAPAFLVSSSGLRRTQGRVAWLNPRAEKHSSQVIDLSWAAVVRSAASRRLPLIADSPVGQDAWRRARARARRYRKAGA